MTYRVALTTCCGRNCCNAMLTNPRWYFCSATVNSRPRNFTNGMSPATIARFEWKKRETREDFAKVSRVGSSSPIYFLNLMEFVLGGSCYSMCIWDHRLPTIRQKSVCLASFDDGTWIALIEKVFIFVELLMISFVRISFIVNRYLNNRVKFGSVVFLSKISLLSNHAYKSLINNNLHSQVSLYILL